MWRALTMAVILVSAFSLSGLPERSGQTHQVQYGIQQPLSVGDVLLASTKLADPNFAESVVLILQHGEDDGTVGLIVNRQSEVPLSKLFPHLKGGSSDPVFQGGPVSPEIVLALVRASTKPEKATRITEDVYVSGNKELIEKSVTSRIPASKFRLYLGYAGWAPGQLEAEMSLGAWSIARGGPRVIFDSDPNSLWLRLTREPPTHIAGLLPHGQPLLTLTSPYWPYLPWRSSSSFHRGTFRT